LQQAIEKKKTGCAELDQPATKNVHEMLARRSKIQDIISYSRKRYEKLSEQAESQIEAVLNGTMTFRQISKFSRSVIIDLLQRECTESDLEFWESWKGVRW